MSKITAAGLSAKLQGIATATDKAIEDAAGERLGFILLVWAGGEVSYIGTDPNRANTIAAMREFIAKWETGEGIPAHLRN
jgi:hypothetical protein